MKNIKFLKNAVIINFEGFTVKLKGELEYADKKTIQTKDGNNYHTIFIDGSSYSYDNMPFSLKR